MPKRKDHLPEFEAPKKKLITEHDRYIKTMYQIQSNVATNLQSELQKQKCFEKGIEKFASTKYTAGTCTLKQLQEDEKVQAQISKLLSYGLTQHDINIYKDFMSKGLEYVQKEYSHHEPEVLKNKIDEILKIIEKHTTLTISDKNIKEHVPHPIDDITLLNSKLMKTIDCSTVCEPDINKIRRKARKVANKLQKVTPVTTTNVETSVPINTDFRSLWDQTESQNDASVNSRTKMRTVQYTCAKQNFYTIKDGEIVKFDDKESILQVTGQLSLDKIIKMPQFSNYNPGSPSNVIYIKNLPKKTTIDDLRRIFKEFPAEDYKIMSGKMRGQAFMTFDSLEIASNMLNKANGLIVNEKPVILQFGRSGLK